MQNVGGVTLSPRRKLGGNPRTLSKAEINRMRLGVNAGFRGAWTVTGGPERKRGKPLRKLLGTAAECLGLSAKEATVTTSALEPGA